MAIIRHSFKSFTEEPAPIETLPFVAFIDGHHRYWHVPPESDYDKACDVGVQYFCDFAQYLKDNPVWVGGGFTAWTFRAMALIDKDTREKGYAVGFAAALERAVYIFATHFDHYAYEQQVKARSVAIEQEIEARQEEEMRKLGYNKPKRQRKAQRKD